MNTAHLSLLVCPISRCALRFVRATPNDQGEVLEGTLVCDACGTQWSIHDGIPSFVGAAHPLSFVLESTDQANGKHALSHSDVSAANRAFYDSFADKYDSLERSVFEPKRQEEIDGCIRDLAARTGAGMVLDVGCGTGNISKFARKYFRAAIGVDISLEALRINKAKTGIFVAHADAQNLPFPDQCFDAITCFSVLHHFFDNASLLRELNRVLKPGGVLFTDNDPNYYFFKYFRWRARLRLLLGLRRLLKNRVTPAQLDIMKIAEFHALDGLKPEELERMMTHAGFSEVETQFYFHPNPDRFNRFLKWVASLYNFRGLYQLFRTYARK